MKRTQIISLLLVIWLLSMVAILFGVNKFIDNKIIDLRSEIRDNLETLFEGESSGGALVSNNDGWFFSDFSYNPVRHYKKATKPAKPDTKSIAKIDSKIANQIIDEWKKNYGDISSLYDLNWGDEYPNQNDEGWNIIRIYGGGTDEEYIHTNVIFPFKVGLKGTEWGNYYTIEQAVNEAYEFYTTSPKSSYANRFRQGSSNTLWSKIYGCENEFYNVAETQKNGYTMGKPIYIPKGKSYDEAQRVMPYENGWMHNGYYRVYIAATQERIYGIKLKEWAVTENRNKLLLWWLCGSTVFFLIFIIPLSIKQITSNKKKSETLYQRLTRLCNPSQFMDSANYDKEKVEKANFIYKTLMDTNPDDKEALDVLQRRASEELGICLINTDQLTELKEKVNPKNFMKPYNAEKVALANELYSILTREGLTYNELTEVQEKAKQL